MTMMEKVLFRMESAKPFDTVVENLEKQVAEQQFRVLAIHDVQKTLVEKGIKREPLKIIEVCNAAFADQALSQSLNVALFMPCKFTVYPEGDRTVVNLARPTMVAEMIPDAELARLAEEVESRLLRIMGAAV
jgi:uncharacterized protein (DUF302 family)